MDVDVCYVRCMAPLLGIPPHRHYDPTDIEDATLRLEWAKLLFRAGYRLRYPQETTGTAILLFHRFLIQERVGKHSRRRDVILTTCLFLAGKVTEAPRRLRDVINVLHMLTRTGQDEPPLLDKAYWTMKERIVEFEQVLLRTINFHVDPPDPYRLLLNYARSLRLDCAATRTAWGLVNDVLFCPRALCTPPPAVACAAILMATRVHGGDRKLRWFSPVMSKRKRRRREDGGRDGDSDDGGGGGTGDGCSGKREDDPEAPIRAEGRNSTAVAVSPTTSPPPPPPPPPPHGSLRGAAAPAGEERGTDGVTSSSGDAHDISGASGGSGGEAKQGDDEPASLPWWCLFDARDEDVELVCSELLALYLATDEDDGAKSPGERREDGDALQDKNGGGLGEEGIR